MKKHAGPVLALVAAVVIVVSALSRSFWHGRTPDGLAEASIGLRSARVCTQGACAIVPHRDFFAGERRLKYWALGATFTFYQALIAAVVLAGAAVLMVTEGRATLNRWAAFLCALLLVQLAAVVMAFPGGPDSHLAWALPTLAGSALLGLLAALALAAQASAGAVEQREAALIKLAASDASAGADTSSGAARAAAARPRARELQDAIKAASGITLAKAVGASAKQPAASASQVRAAAADATAELLRFVVRELELGTRGLTARAGGATRELSWSELAEVHAGQLPADAPFERLHFVDLVPAGPPRPGAPYRPDGPAPLAEPLRLLPSTRVNYAALPGGAATTSLDNLRRLVAHAQTQQPALSLDAETAAFSTGGQARRYLAVEQFARYDARYG